MVVDVIAAGRFKAVCLKVLDDVTEAGVSVTPPRPPRRCAVQRGRSGVPVNIVADAGSYVEDHSVGAFVVRKDLVDSGEVDGIDDLAGRKLVATGEGIAMDMFNHILLGQAGLTPDDVELTYIGFPDMMTALGSGQIDAAQLTEQLGEG
jgi:ABC-type nitrate/sulfonate/bicarbonate transport system substrate-binding protein